MMKRHKYENDKALIDGVCKNEPQAHKELYLIGRNQIKSFVILNSGSYEDFADIQQNTVIAMLEKIKLNKLSLTSTLEALMFGMAKNLWYKELRKRGKEYKLPLLDEAQEEESLYYEIEEMKIRSVMKLFQIMDEDCKQILTMRFWGNEKLENIANILDKNLSAIKMKSKRCLDHLFIKYKGYEYY